MSSPPPSITKQFASLSDMLDAQKLKRFYKILKFEVFP